MECQRASLLWPGVTVAAVAAYQVVIPMATCWGLIQPIPNPAHTCSYLTPFVCCLPLAPPPPPPPGCSRVPTGFVFYPDLDLPAGSETATTRGTPGSQVSGPPGEQLADANSSSTPGTVGGTQILPKWSPYLQPLAPPPFAIQPTNAQVSPQG